MALDLTGITNQNTFYADYYLHALLGKDLSDWVRSRRAAGQNFWGSLKKLGGVYR